MVTPQLLSVIAEPAVPLIPSSCAACSGSGGVAEEVTVTGTVCVSDCGTPVLVTVENFPAAPLAASSVLLAEALANPTVTQVGSHLLTYDPTGPCWNRVHSGPTLGSILVDQGPASWTVDGAVSVLNLPAVQPVSGAVAVSNLPAVQTVVGAVAVSNFPGVQPISGAVSVSNFPSFPAVQPVSGAVSVSNFPAFPATQVVSGAVSVSNFPAFPAFPAVQPVSGAVSVANFPAVQPVSGAVSVSNFPAFPATQVVSDGGGSLTVDGAVSVSNFPAFPAVQPVSGSLAVSNFPASQPVTGAVSVSNFPAFPAVQPVSGAVAVSNFPSSFAVSNLPAVQTIVGVVALDAASLAALEYINVGLDAPSLAALEFINVAGGEANDAPALSNPVLTAGRASAVAPVAVSVDGDVATFWATRNGRQRVYSSGRRRAGVYYASLGSFTIALGADASGVGRFYILNPIGSGTVAAIRKIYYSMSTTTALAVATSPIITVERITFTGAASGAAITPVKRDSADAAQAVTIRTINTGIVTATVGALHGFQVPAALATTSVALPEQAFPSGTDEDEWIILRAGEGVIIRQSTAGTNLDTRSCSFDITWEEYATTDLAIRD